MAQSQITQQAVVVPQTTMRTDMTSAQISLFDQSGDPITFDVLPTGDDVLLTGYVDATAGDVAPTDTLNEALAKLEARIVALESV